MGTTDCYSYASRLRRMNRMEKFFFSILSLLLCVFFQSVTAALLVFACNTWLLLVKSGLPLRTYLRLLLVPLFFLLTGTAAVLFQFSPTPLDAFALPLGPVYLTAGRSSVLLSIRLFCTALAAVSCLYFLSLTTPVTDLLAVLETLHCPSLLCWLMLLTYRFIFLLLELAHAIKTAQVSRLGNRNFSTSLRAFGLLGPALLIQAIQKSGQFFDAMESRCYSGSIRVLHNTTPSNRREILWICLFLLILLGVSLTERMHLWLI